MLTLHFSFKFGIHGVYWDRMFLDIGLGIFIAFFVSSVWEVPVNGVWIGAGILFALLPDADYLIHLIRGNSSRNAHRHRDLFHRPLLFLPAGMLAFYSVGIAWSVLFGLCALAHFIHDSIGIGWGVQWLWPLGDKHYSFFYIYKPKHRPGKLPRKLLYIWEHDKINEINERYGDEEWIRNIYLRWHPYVIIEFAVFLAALITLFIYVR